MIRLADGGKNHCHPVEIDPPSRLEVGTFKEAIELRMQCQQLGLNPCTGIVKDINKRCDIYRQRIVEHFRAVELAAQARRRNEGRTELHQLEKQRVGDLSAAMLKQQCWDACHANRPDRVLQIVQRGCDPNEESPRGLTPLMCLILNECTSESIADLISKKADVNYVNRSA